MRQWHVNPKLMCKHHLLGEHVEHHMFASSINNGKSIQGYLDNNLLEPNSLRKRHDEIVKEMLRRGYKHNVPLPAIDYSNLTSKQLTVTIDRDQSLQDLLTRCRDCRELN